MRARCSALRTGCMVDDQLVILDRAQSRYLLVPGCAHEPVSTPPPRDGQSLLLSWDQDGPPLRRTARETWFTLASSAAVAPTTRAGLRALARTAWLEKRTEWRLRHAGLAAGLDGLDRVHVGDDDAASQTRFVAAAWQSRRLWSAENKCLPQSIGLAMALREAGAAARLVIGVRLRPFAAHAWVQDRETILNDTLDHVLLFTPVLVA